MAELSGQPATWRLSDKVHWPQALHGSRSEAGEETKGRRKEKDEARRGEREHKEKQRKDTQERTAGRGENCELTLSDPVPDPDESQSWWLVFSTGQPDQGGAGRGTQSLQGPNQKWCAKGELWKGE